MVIMVADRDGVLDELQLALRVKADHEIDKAGTEEIAGGLLRGAGYTGAGTTQSDPITRPILLIAVLK